MEAKQIELYDRHGCCIKPRAGKKLMIIEYNVEVTNHEFNGAYQSGGLFEKLAEATAIAKQYPGYEEYLGIPDLVFMCDEEIA
ncbi:MAG: hypothetical protein ACRC62_09985 [Microcoleus sp.]